ncbi:MAG: transketolase [Bacteroidetes bacterium]|nr:transketolase [Bacteroidota bacterium]
MINSSDARNNGLLKLLQIKDSDIRMLTLEQGFHAVDKGIHAGGAMSSVIPLVALFYGGSLSYNVIDPTLIGQDLFVLSKGHAVATLASIYADLGFFDKSVLNNSRSEESLLNGHPGPILPGISISTGPLGQGCCVAQGYAVAGKMEPNFDVFSILGDGELQEGLVWESVMYASQKKLDNLCFIIDKNNGQLDRSDKTILSMEGLAAQFEAFGWNVLNIDGTQYLPVFNALRNFKELPRNGKPSVIICNTTKGFGAFSQFFQNHKIVISEELIMQEMALQKSRRVIRESDLLSFLVEHQNDKELIEYLRGHAKEMNYSLASDFSSVSKIPMQKKLFIVPERNKKIDYDTRKLPFFDPEQTYLACDIITSAMKVFACNERIVSIDADLSSTSGLEKGVGYIDKRRALNVGIAEANMMNIGEAFAALGYNVWVSTFCPFFDIKVLRRIAVGQQERLEAIADTNNWLSAGHGLDLTFLATAPNFETKTNGATHMGNDDIKLINELGCVKIIDISCPNMLLGVMKWIMEGGKGLVYIRIMRAASGIIYKEVVNFEYGESYYISRSDKTEVTIISSGRGTFEAMEAAQILKDSYSISANVIDMPTVDRERFKELNASNDLKVFAEQNNGYLWTEYRKLMFQESVTKKSPIIAINTATKDDRPQYIHSATYEQLLEKFGLAPQQIADMVRSYI